MVLEPQLRCNPEFYKFSRYFPFLDSKYFPALKRSLRAHVASLQFPKIFVNSKFLLTLFEPLNSNMSKKQFLQNVYWFHATYKVVEIMANSTPSLMKAKTVGAR